MDNMFDNVFMPKSVDELKQCINKSMKEWLNKINEAKSLCDSYLEANNLNESNSYDIEWVTEKQQKIQKIINLYNDKFNKNLEILSELNPLSIIDSVILKKIITNGYNKSKSNFSDNIEEHSFNEIVNKLNKLILICQKKEEPIKTELSKLC